MADITTKGKALPNRWGFYAGNGFGKTSMLCYAPAPIFLMTAGETGLRTLIEARQVPETPSLPELKTWPDLLAAVRFLRTEPHTYKSLVLDTANGAERMCHEYVCEVFYGGDWDGKEYGFLAWGGKGYDTAMSEWRVLLNALDQLREERGMAIFFLMHTKLKVARNPSGPDYDKFSPEMHEKTWNLTRGWLDATLAGVSEVLVNTGKKLDRKGKVAETSHRMLYTSFDNPIFDAKNRFGLPDEIEMGTSPQEAWNNFAEAVRESRKTGENA